MLENDPDELRAQLDRIEDRLEELGKSVSSSRTGGGGIGCLGLVLFIVVLVKLEAILDLLR